MDSEIPDPTKHLPCHEKAEALLHGRVRLLTHLISFTFTLFKNLVNPLLLQALPMTDARDRIRIHFSPAMIRNAIEVIGNLRV